MNVEITNENLYLLLPGKAALVSGIYQDLHGGTALDALRRFYYSDLYRQLEKEETKLWHLGPVALYEEMEERKSIR